MKRLVSLILISLFLFGVCYSADYRYKKNELNAERVDRIEDKDPLSLIKEYQELIAMFEEEKDRIDERIAEYEAEIAKIQAAMK